MRPERSAKLVARWVRLYTRSLPPEIARRRIEEIDADLHDQIAHERAAGSDERRIARGIAARMLRGVAADLSWRGHAAARRPAGGGMAATRRAVVRIALVTALVLLVPLVAMQFTDEVAWSVADFVSAAVLLSVAGLLLQTLAAGRPGSTAYRAAAIAVGFAAIAFGGAGDAPGLMLFGGLLIAATVVLAVRTARHHR